MSNNKPNNPFENQSIAAKEKGEYNKNSANAQVEGYLKLDAENEALDDEFFLERAAIAAMQGILSNPQSDETIPRIAEVSYEYAESLLAEKKKRSV